jgi:ribosomal protein L3 glutamine methyltransferase
MRFLPKLKLSKWGRVVMSWQIQYEERKSRLETIGDWLSFVEEILESEAVYLGHGTDNYWDEALQLVFAAIQIPLTTGREILGEFLEQREKNRVIDFLGKRVDQRQPLPYITNQAWFMGMPFFVDERVLIPRSPMGEWISKAFSPFLKPNTVKRICDIGTGSGCIAIGLALAFPQAKVDAVDICQQALSVAEKNIMDYELSSRIRTILGDALSAVEGESYDLIVSNPPYVPDAENALLPEEYRHEPAKALFSGVSGLDIVEGILSSAYRYLNKGGILVLEVGQTAVTLIKRYPQLPFLWLSCENGGEGLFLLMKEQLPIPSMGSTMLEDAELE